MTIKNHMMRIFILSIYTELSLFFGIFAIFLFLSWLQLDLNTTLQEWKDAIVIVLFLSSKLSLIGIPIGFVLWFFYYRNM